MSECHIRGCRNLKTICTDCGRVVSTATRPKCENGCKSLEMRCTSCGKLHSSFDLSARTKMNIVDRWASDFLSINNIKKDSREAELVVMAFKEGLRK